jgi:hypothetical protein
MERKWRAMGFLLFGMILSSAPAQDRSLPTALLVSFPDAPTPWKTCSGPRTLKVTAVYSSGQPVPYNGVGRAQSPSDSKCNVNGMEIPIVNGVGALPNSVVWYKPGENIVQVSTKDGALKGEAKATIVPQEKDIKLEIEKPEPKPGYVWAGSVFKVRIKATANGKPVEDVILKALDSKGVIVSPQTLVTDLNGFVECELFTPNFLCPASSNGVARPPAGPLRRAHERFFAAMERALEQGEIRLNAPAGDGYVGAKFLCAVYPEYFDKLLELMKREYGSDPDVRGMEGSKDLVTGLSLNTDVIYADPNRGFWKFRFDADMGKDAPRVREGDAVLLFLEMLPEGCRRAVQKIGAAPGGWAFRFLVDSKPLDIGDLKGDGANAYDGPAIVGALKEALLSGQLSASLPMRQVFVTHKATYFVVPACLDAIFGREEVARGWNMNRMLDAMMRTGAVVPGPDGRAMVTVRVGSMRGAVDVVGIDTTKILNWDELGKLEADGKTCPDPIRIVEKVPA